VDFLDVLKKMCETFSLGSVCFWF